MKYNVQSVEDNTDAVSFDDPDCTFGDVLSTVHDHFGGWDQVKIRFMLVQEENA